MAKDPAFLFYTSDFLTGTMFMTNEQIGIYIRLLCSQHQHGGLIDKDSFIAMVGSNNLVKNKFIETDQGFYNERLAIVMDERNQKSNNLSKAAKEIWEKRKQENTIVLQKYNKGNTKVSKKRTIAIQPEDENEVVNYFSINGYSIEAAKKFFKYYDTAKWVDSNGKKILNWKQKAQSVWFKEENKIKDPEKPKMVW